MKVCPQCDRTYHDDELNFCLMDGTPLNDGASQPTITFPSSTARTEVMSPRTTNVDPTQKKKSIWLPLTLGIVGVLIGLSLAATAIYFVSTRKSASKAGDNASNERPSKAPKPAPTKTASPPVPTPTKSEETSADDVIDAPIDATPILWMTTGVPFENDTADFTIFLCPKDGDAFPIYGIDTYEASSSICTAAVHAGLITFESGGKVKVEFNDGAKTFGGNMRNGVTSNASGESDSGFVFLKR